MTRKRYFKLCIPLLKFTEWSSQYVRNKVATVAATNVRNVTNKRKNNVVFSLETLLNMFKASRIFLLRVINPWYIIFILRRTKSNCMKVFLKTYTPTEITCERCKL